MGLQARGPAVWQKKKKREIDGELKKERERERERERKRARGPLKRVGKTDTSSRGTGSEYDQIEKNY